MTRLFYRVRHGQGLRLLVLQSLPRFNRKFSLACSRTWLPFVERRGADAQLPAYFWRRQAGINACECSHDLAVGNILISKKH